MGKATEIKHFNNSHYPYATLNVITFGIMALIHRVTWREAPHWLIMLLPLVYLHLIWESLPEVVPTHFDLHGKADGWSNRHTLIWMAGSLSAGTYFLMLLLPRIDPRRHINLSDIHYTGIRLLLTVFIALLNGFIIQSSLLGGIANTSFLFGLLGGVFAGFGWLFRDLKPNYFIGIRTPWTLESEEVWYSTHRFGAKVWMAGGILLAIGSMFFTHSSGYLPLFFGVLLVMVILPVYYSWRYFKNESSR